MVKGTMNILARMRLLVVVLMLAVAINAAAPKPAQAQQPTGPAQVASMGICALSMAYPAVYAACTAIASSAIAQAIGRVIETHMEGLMTRIQILTGARLAEARMNANTATETGAARATTTQELLPSPTLSSCAVYTAVGALDGYPDGGGGAGGAGGSRETPRPSVTRRDGPGVSTFDVRCPAGSGSVDCSAKAQAAVNAALNQELRSPLDPTARALDRSRQDQQYRPCTGADAAACEAARTAAGDAAPEVYADVQASTLLGYDTLEGETDPERDTSFNSALLYCANLIVPGNTARVSGPMSGDRAIQQAKQRANDSRVSLAIDACAAAVGRRQGIPFNASNPTYDWIIAAACSYRRAFTNYDNGTGETIAAPNAALNAALDAACPVLPSRTADGTTAPAAVVNNVTSSTMHLSRLELLRIISTDMFTVPQFALHTGSANVTELQRMLIAMESVNTQINMEMLRMQEQLTLIEAASLSVEVKTK